MQSTSLSWKWSRLLALPMVIGMVACDQPLEPELALEVPGIFEAKGGNKGKKGGGDGNGGHLAMTATFESSGVGVTGDGAPYIHGGEGGIMQVAISTAGRQAELVTYFTGRGFNFTPDASPAWAAAGLPTTPFSAESDIFNNNYFAAYDAMGIESVAQVQADLEFHWGNKTYELDYPALGVQRISETEWLFSSDACSFFVGTWQLCGVTFGFNNGVGPQDEATLNTIRRRRQSSSGTVHMPITFRLVVTGS